MSSNTRIVEGIEYGPAVTIVRNADGTLERVKEDVQAEVAKGARERSEAQKAQQAHVRAQQLIAARKREAARQAARIGKQALEPKI